MFVLDSDSEPIKDHLETVECPNCRFHIPVIEQFIDYSVLYKEQLKQNKKLEEMFVDYINDMADECPEVKIYVHNKRAEIFQLFEEAKRKFRIYMKGESEG